MMNLNYYSGLDTYFLTGMVTGITWGGDITQASRSINVTLNNTIDGEKRALNIELGKQVRLYDGLNEIFRGNVFSTNINSDGMLQFTAFDDNHYLVKNTDSMKFINKKASEVLTSICKQYGIRIGHIDDTGYIIPKLILRDKTLYDMITIALTETKKKTGKVFLLSNNKGQIELHEQRNRITKLNALDGTNILSASYSESIENLKNAVRLTGESGEDAKGISVRDEGSIAKYGLMQEKQHESEKTDAELKPIANALLKELNKVENEFSVEVIGNVSVIAGKTIEVTEEMTGINGLFYVSSDSHRFNPNGFHTMTLTISKTLDQREMEYVAPDENKDVTKVGSVSSNDSASLNVVELARSYIGKLTYSFGGKNIEGGSGDCSGFTYYVYLKAAGIDLGQGTSNQVRKGTKISKSEAKAGDLVFFQGTYRDGVSHVGIVTRKGYCISLASSGCKEHSYETGYWGNHYMQIRRVLS